MISLCPTAEHGERSGTTPGTAGSRKPRFIQVQIPSVYDKTVAPEGQHVLSMWVYFLPSHVRDGESWSEERQELWRAAH